MKFGMTLLVLGLVFAALVMSRTLNIVRGSGNIVTRREEFTGFDSLDIGYAFRAKIRQGDSFEVTIRVDDNLVQYLDVRQTGTTAHIGFKPGTGIMRGTMEVDVTMPQLVSLKLSGASKGTISGFSSDNSLVLDLSGASSLQGDIRFGNMRLELSGASDAKLTGNTGDVTVGASGASRVNLGGSAGNLSVNASGASKIDVSGLTAHDAQLKASGASEIWVNVSGRLDADISGASHITYVGTPTMGTIQTSGGSTVRTK